MPNVTAQLPALGADPWGPDFVVWATALRDAINGIISSAAPLPLGPAGVAGTSTGAVAAADHVHPTTGMATSADLAAAIVGAGGTPATRTITAGTGLTGGGTMEQDRTISADFGTAAGKVAAGDDSRITGAVQSATTAAATTTAVLAVALAADLVSRFGVRGDGTVSHGEPPLTVSNVTGTSTVTVTTSAAHGYGTGDVVTIAGVQSFSGANGTFTITRTTTTAFTLDGATGSGTYTSGGTTQRKLGGTGSALEGVWNLLQVDTTRDGLVLRAKDGSLKDLLVTRDALGATALRVPYDGRMRLKTAAGHEDELLMHVHRRELVLAATGSGTTLAASGMAGPTVATTNITATVDNTAAGPLVKYATTAASGVDAGVISDFGRLQARWGPYFYARISTDASAVTSTRLAAGLVSAEVAADAGPASTGAYSTAEGAWLRYDTAVDGTAFWRAVSGGGTTATVTTTTAAIAADTSYELVIEVDVAVTAVRFWVNGVLVATHTTNLPGSSTSLGYTARLRTLAASARALRFGRISIGAK